MTKVTLAILIAMLIALPTLGQNDDPVATVELRCGTIAEILLDHGDKFLFRDVSLINQSFYGPWRTVYDTISPLATAYGCPPMARQRQNAPTGPEITAAAGPEITAPAEINPDANISFPPPVYLVRHKVEIRGTAAVFNLSNFFVEFRPLDSDAEPGDEVDLMWFPATLPEIKPVRDGILGTWNTESLRDGLYELRLRISTHQDPPLYVYLSPIRVEKMPSFAAAGRADAPAEVTVPSDLGAPLVFTSEEYGLSTVIGPLAVPKGLHLVKWRNISDYDEGELSVNVYALTPCFEFNESGSDEDLLFGYGWQSGQKTELLKVVEDGCRILMEVNAYWRLRSWEIELYSAEAG